MGMKQDKSILVTGATGQQGGAVVRNALMNGYRVRALVRNPLGERAVALRRQGAELIHGQYEDIDSLVSAALGMHAVFMVTVPSDRQTEMGHASGIIKACREAEVRHLVYSSAANANLSTGIPHFETKAEIEGLVRESSIPWTIVAPVYYMENNASAFALAGLAEGRVARWLPVDCPLQQVALDDIGKFVIASIERGDAMVGRRVDIAGDSLTSTEIAQFLTDILGKKQHPTELSLSSFPRNSELMESVSVMLKWLATDGFSVNIPSLKASFPEVKWTSFVDWASTVDWS